MTQKTIQRDVTFMREALGLPIAYDSVKHGYHYTGPVSDFPMVRLSVEDLVALFLARRALEPLQGTPLETTLRDSFRRISSTLKGEVSFHWSHLDEAFSVRASGVVPGDVALFEKLARAVLESREIRFQYRKIDGDSWEDRALRPFHLAEFEGGWYLIGHDPVRKARRTFAVQRMRSVRLLKSQFLRPADFCPNDHLGGSFGVWHTPETKDRRHRIRLRFRDWAARMVSERRWHPSQQLTWIDEKNDLLEIALELAGFEEVRRWILSWGPQVEVLEPSELRGEIAASLKGTLACYGEG